mgnify:CR=1 FL=1
MARRSATRVLSIWSNGERVGTGVGPRCDVAVDPVDGTTLLAKEVDPARDILLLEGSRIGWAASGRNGGFVASSLTHGLAQGLACWPDEVATLERLADENRAGLEATLTTHGIDADYHVPGEITIQCIEGAIEVAFDGGTQVLQPRQMLYLARAVSHGVKALQDSSVARRSVRCR